MRNLDEWSFIRHKNVGSRLFRFVTKHAFDRQTDGRTDRQRGDSNAVRLCIRSQSHGNYAVGPEVEPRPVPVQPPKINACSVKPPRQGTCMGHTYTHYVCACFEYFNVSLFSYMSVLV